MESTTGNRENGKTGKRVEEERERELGSIDKLIYDRLSYARAQNDVCRSFTSEEYSILYIVGGRSDGGERVPMVMHFLVDPATFHCKFSPPETHPPMTLPHVFG